jgi:hypothetical protein
MYSAIKNAARSAGYPVSEGGDLPVSDLQPLRDFIYFEGLTVGEEFHLFEGDLKKSPLAELPAQLPLDNDNAQPDPADQSDTPPADETAEEEEEAAAEVQPTPDELKANHEAYTEVHGDDTEEESEEAGEEAEDGEA